MSANGAWMKGLNNVTISGNLSKDPIYGTARDSTVLSFEMIQQRKRGDKGIWVRVNVFSSGLVRACEREDLKKGHYVQVEGSLMNREGNNGQLVEIRANDLVIDNKPGRRDG